MGLFDNAAELERKENLKKLEDKRLAFAQSMANQGFAPERMLFAQTERGGFMAVCRDRGQFAVIIGPAFGSDEDYRMVRMDALNFRRQDVHVPSEGMGGIFGMGKKAETGVEFIISLPDGEEVKMPFVGGRSSWMERELKKNPLLSTKRRRGDANLCWDMMPLDRTSVSKAMEAADRYFPKP